MNNKFAGSSVAIVTPMTDAGDIDYPALKSLIDWQVSAGTDSIVVAGTTGESPTLSVAEHQQLIAKTVAMVAGRIPVIAGVGANSTQEAIALTQHGLAAGADAGLSVVPYYNKPTQEGLYRHFTSIADACELPLLLYDVPGRTITSLNDETVVRLAKHPHIIGIKDATGEVERVGRLSALLGDGVDNEAGFLQMTGDDKTAKEYLLAGGDGVISVTANVAPSAMKTMILSARQGDRAAADKEDDALVAFHTVQGIESNPIPVKAALHFMGKIGRGIRLPLTPLSGQHHAAVKSALNQFL